MAHYLPLYLYVPGDLARAGIRFRAPYLRFHPRDPYAPRASCKWCGAYDLEYGHHLVRCRQAPPRVRALRDRALRQIQQDVQLDAPARHDSEDNLRRLFDLCWVGKCEWRRSRPDRGTQPSESALKAALLYMREAINTYSEATAGGRTNPVWTLPRYVVAPEVSPEELLAVEPRPSEAASSQDSLWLLSSPEIEDESQPWDAWM